MNRTTLLQERRMQTFQDVLGYWQARRLSALEAAELLGMSERSFRRYRQRYEEEGPDGLFDRRLGKASARRVPADRVAWVLDESMGACGAFQVARAEARGGMPGVRACRRAPPAVCMPKRPRIRSARAGQRPAPRHHQGEGPTAISGRDSALARARSTVKCCQNPGQIKSETRSDKIRTGGQVNRNPQAALLMSQACQ